MELSMCGRILFISIIFTLSGCFSKNISDAKDGLEKRLKDPDSVKYRNVQEYSENVVCGEYNAKNSYGAYGGYETFIWRNGGLDTKYSYQKEKLLCSNDPNKMYIYGYISLTKVCSETGKNEHCKLAKYFADEYTKHNPESRLPSLSEWSDIEL